MEMPITYANYLHFGAHVFSKTMMRPIMNVVVIVTLESAKNVLGDKG